LYWDGKTRVSEAAPTGVAFCSTPLLLIVQLADIHGQTMTFSPETKSLARSLLAYETAAGQSSGTDSVAVRVCEKLRGPLCALAGVASYRSILSRALTLATAEASSLGALQITETGSLQEPGKASSSDRDQAAEGELLLTVQLLGLFLSLLGGAVTLQLVQEVFPNLTITTEPGTITPFEDILKEVYQLHGVSDRLESLASQTPSVEEPLLSVSGNIRNTANTLEVLALIKTKAANPQKKKAKQPRKRYLM
jgi:hypothetical protein